ncbi:MAG: histone deacetylase [Acidobacteriia bacterium]|nr:histone deacetylase [Terriglobia bacterium]
MSETGARQPLPFRLVYSELYDLHLGEHVFPSKKYRWLHDRLIRTRFAAPEDFIEPSAATDDDLRLVHDPEWVAKLRSGTLTYQDILRLEIPYSRQMVEAFWLAAGGTILAARLARESGVGFNIGGGFHHAFPGHGEGFCAINDIAVAIRRLQRDGTIRRAMVVDCDVHHGNGTAAVFAGDPSVFTLSIHQYNNYPSEKPPSSLDIHLADGIGDGEYLHRLGNGYRAALTMFQPELVIYVAGADPYFEDQLGGLSLTFDGLKERDRLVIWTALTHRIPVAIVLAGGYAQSVEDTITIHANTAAVAKEIAGKTWAAGQTEAGPVPTGPGPQAG